MKVLLLYRQRLPIHEERPALRAPQLRKERLARGGPSVAGL
ncbi:hypothetical protein BN871_CS_00050 [Paenibacillus sp. P22]|nr:hypothetical protein BN871_CS_00050 [Paenibacillus sp. P22]